MAKRDQMGGRFYHGEITRNIWRWDGLGMAKVDGPFPTKRWKKTE